MFLNNSGAEEFEDCARKRFWSKEYNGTGLESTFRNDNLDFGTITHVGLAELYAGEPFYAEKAKDTGRMLLNFDTLYYEDRNKWIEHFNWIERILRAYEEQMKPKDDFTIIQIEAEGCVTLGEICFRCGEPYPVPMEDNFEDILYCEKCITEIHHWVFRVDMAVNKGEHKPKVNIIDHKTTSSLGDNYILSWHNSLQMWGYCYGYQKQSGMEVSGYIVNILRKLKSIGLPEETTKACPECRNGVKKRIGCLVCKGEGKVLREAKPDDVPFVREEDSWNEYKQEIFVLNRLNTINRIKDEQERFKHEPETAWPMNPKSCFKMGRCPFWKLCYTPQDPMKWYEPTDDQLINFQPRPADYVSVKQLAREEMD